MNKAFLLTLAYVDSRHLQIIIISYNPLLLHALMWANVSDSVEKHIVFHFSQLNCLAKSYTVTVVLWIVHLSM